MGTEEDRAEYIRRLQNPEIGGETEEERYNRLAQHELNHDPGSHMRPGGIFDPNTPQRDIKQRFRRQEEIQKFVEQSIGNIERVQDPGGDLVLKVSFKEWQSMMKDPEFIPMSKYVANLTHYADGRPRARPVRPLIVNEVGMYRGKIVFLKDAGPDDVGESAYHQVHADTPLLKDVTLVDGEVVKAIDDVVAMDAAAEATIDLVSQESDFPPPNNDAEPDPWGSGGESGGGGSSDAY